MNDITQALRKTYEEIPKLLLRRILGRKIQEAGVVLSLDGMEALVQHILSKNEGTFHWEDGASDCDVNLKLTFTKKDEEEIEVALANIAASIPDAVLSGLKATGEDIFKSLCERWHIEHLAQKYELEGFQDRLEERWGEPLSYLRMTLTCCREIGANTSSRHAKSKSKRHKLRRWVLVRLHTRACQVTDEVICLLQNGFADGAMARWRTLHELSIVATIIADGDEDLAERYIAHDAVEVKRQADVYDQAQTELGHGHPTISKRDRASIDKNYNRAIDRYGSEFAHPYGWAAKHLRQKKPTFKELQATANRAVMNSYYKLASFNVHAGARSLFFNLSSMGFSEPLIAGRSNAGLEEPGTRAAHTIVLITTLYANNTTDLKRLSELHGLIRLRDAVSPAFERAARMLRKEVESAIKQSSKL